MAPLQLAPRHLRTLRALLAQHAPRAEVWAYGSRVTGGAHEGSGLDLVPRDPAGAAGPVQGLVEALENSGLPMLVELHDWSQLSAAFRAEIERGHVVVQAAQATASSRR